MVSSYHFRCLYLLAMFSKFYIFYEFTSLVQNIRFTLEFMDIQGHDLLSVEMTQAPDNTFNLKCYIWLLYRYYQFPIKVNKLNLFRGNSVNITQHNIRCLYIQLENFWNILYTHTEKQSSEE